MVALGPGRGAQRVWDQQLAVMQCAYCEQNIVVIEEELHDGQRGKESGRISWRGIHWWPVPGSADLSPDIPAAVASAYSEGMRALPAKAPRAAVVMFRGMLAQFVNDKGSPAAQAKHTLYHRLEQMNQDGSLHPSLVEWAKEIRVLGNAAAHPDSLDPVSEDEAAELGRSALSAVA